MFSQQISYNVIVHMKQNDNTAEFVFAEPCNVFRMFNCMQRLPNAVSLYLMEIFNNLIYLNCVLHVVWLHRIDRLMVNTFFKTDCH